VLEDWNIYTHGVILHTVKRKIIVAGNFWNFTNF